jgi:GxxExxY protein
MIRSNRDGEGGAETVALKRRPRNTRKGRNRLLLESESYRIRGAAFEVYRQLGCGFLESVYQECLEREFRERRIPHHAQHRINLRYKGTALLHTFAADFLCYDQIIVELKAVSRLAPEHRAQLHNYLKASGKPLGLLINFGHHPKAEIERLILTHKNTE